MFDVLIDRGYALIGPTVRDGAIVLSPITSVADLPAGVRDEQAPAHYRLASSGDLDSGEGASFGFAATATSWKPFLFPARRTLWELGPGSVAEQPDADETPRAFIGVRSCDLHAIRVLDGVLTQRPFADPDYASRRSAVFIVAVTCGHPGGTREMAASRPDRHRLADLRRHHVTGVRPPGGLGRGQGILPVNQVTGAFAAASGLLSSARVVSLCSSPAERACCPTTRTAHGAVRSRA
jgi:hypothetical protein